MAGNMIARQLEASAPMSDMNRSRRGISAAAMTGDWEWAWWLVSVGPAGRGALWRACRECAKSGLRDEASEMSLRNEEETRNAESEFAKLGITLSDWLAKTTSVCVHVQHLFSAACYPRLSAAN